MSNDMPYKKGYGMRHPQKGDVPGDTFAHAAGFQQDPQPQVPQPLQMQQQMPQPQQQQPRSYAYGMPAQPNYAGVYHVPVTSQPQNLPKKKRGKGFWIGIIIAILALIAAAAIAWFMFSQEEASKRAGALGQLEGKTEAEIQAELNRYVEEGMFNISIASSVQFDSGTSQGELKIENVPGNRYLMQVEIAREDNGQVIYTSGILDPNYHIQEDTLDVDLPAGVYPCVATFTALDPETEDEIGTAAAKITISVLS